MWVDRDGTVTTPPTNAADAWVNGALVGFDVLLLGGAVLVGIWMWVRRLTASSTPLSGSGNGPGRTRLERACAVMRPTHRRP
ncbi:MAG: hypothetical protein JWR81_4740 [Pseudonocardia sp.]|nr:hypothetical protein [Pseudonocardia sp.]MDT7618158.1 hypothetical protein [Pseudonocardiales bacterium]